MNLSLRTLLRCGPRGGRGTLNVRVSATVNHGSVRQQEVILEDGQDVSPGTSGGDKTRSCNLRAVRLQQGGHPWRLHDLAPGSAENVEARRPRGVELRALLGVLEEVLVGLPRWGGSPRPHSHNAPVVPRGAGGQAQPKLERVEERAVAEREGVVDEQGGEPDGGGFEGAAQQTGFVLLCSLQRTTPIMGRGKRPQAAAGGGA